MDIDINTVRGLITALMMFAFIGMVFWAYSSKRRSAFQEAASLPFDEQDQQASSTKGDKA